MRVSADCATLASLTFAVGPAYSINPDVRDEGLDKRALQTDSKPMQMPTISRMPLLRLL
jgi:hypothetical protein